MPWPLPGGTVKEPADDQNFNALAQKGSEVEEALAKVEAEGLPPTGKVGGVLSGELPNPGFATPQATKGELENEEATRAAADKTEKEAREAADTTLTSADATEKSARETGDNERVKGPASATESDIAVYSGTTGKVIKDGGKTVAQVLARENHTGTQLASTVSDFDTQVRKSRLDQMATPTANVSFGSKKITSLLDPTENLDAANKEYVDAAASAAAAGLSVKNPVSYATAVALTTTAEAEKTLEGNCPLTVDGKTAPAIGTRLLVKNQVSEKRNGLYEVTKDECIGGEGTIGGEGEIGVGSKWLLTRTSDADTEAEVKQGMFVLVTLGATNGSTTWILTTENPVVIGTTSQTFAAFTAQPIGPAGGDLTGTYPNPSIGTGVIVNADVNSAAEIAYSKLKLAESLVEGDLAAALKLVVVTQPVRSTVETLKTIRGIVNTAGSGSIVKGSGFTIVRNATGDVTITFTAAFSDTPTVTQGLGETAIIGATKLNAAPTSSTARVLVFLTTTGAASDGIFHFQAIGPR